MKKMSKAFEELEAQQQKAETIIDEWQKQVADIKEGKISDKSVEKPEDQKDNEEDEKSQNESSGMVGINAGKLAHMLASAMTRTQVQAVMAKMQPDLQECGAGKNNGMEVDEKSGKAVEQLVKFVGNSFK